MKKSSKHKYKPSKHEKNLVSKKNKSSKQKILASVQIW